MVHPEPLGPWFTRRDEKDPLRATMVHWRGRGAEANPLGAAGTVVHWQGRGPETNPLGDTGTVFHPPEEGTEVYAPVAGVAALGPM